LTDLGLRVCCKFAITDVNQQFVERPLVICFKKAVPKLIFLHLFNTFEIKMHLIDFPTTKGKLKFTLKSNPGLQIEKYEMA